jgi:Zn-dependent peptidase ImmA (M78 family)
MLDTKAIDDKTTALLTDVFGKVDDIKLPIDLNVIADYCNLKILQGSFKNNNVEGALDRSNKTVYLLQDDSFERKNFTLAHEIGHLKLHEDVKTELFFMQQLDQIADLQTHPEDDIEADADKFAASLLIPEPLIKSLWKINRNVEYLAKIFGVPMVVMRYRLKALKLR